MARSADHTISPSFCVWSTPERASWRVPVLSVPVRARSAAWMAGTPWGGRSAGRVRQHGRWDCHQLQRFSASGEGNVSGKSTDA